MITTHTVEPQMLEPLKDSRMIVCFMIALSFLELLLFGTLTFKIGYFYSVYIIFFLKLLFDFKNYYNHLVHLL